MCLKNILLLFISLSFLVQPLSASSSKDDIINSLTSIELQLLNLQNSLELKKQEIVKLQNSITQLKEDSQKDLQKQKELLEQSQKDYQEMWTQYQKLLTEYDSLKKQLSNTTQSRNIMIGVSVGVSVVAIAEGIIIYLKK